MSVKLIFELILKKFLQHPHGSNVRFPTKISQELVTSNHIPFDILTNFEYINFGCKNKIELVVNCNNSNYDKSSFTVKFVDKCRKRV